MENSDITHVLVTPEGDICTHRTVITKRNVDEVALLGRLSNGRPVKVANLAKLSHGYNCGICTVESESGTLHYVSVPIHKLTLRTQFEVREGLATPLFRHPNELPDMPVLTAPWDVAIATGRRMRLMLLVTVDGNYNSTCCRLLAGTNDAIPMVYHIPIPNLHGDCKVCTGRYDSVGESVLDSVERALAQFQGSDWNSDLHSSTEKQNGMFRFKFSNDGFETLPTSTGWHSLSDKVGIPEMQYCVWHAVGGGQ